ncbi:MAG: vitamin K epoxide reductase [Chloroflexi bacterium]|nr:MAG: vitamin K epoxide reductase [Chloroflexota bacterium]MBL1195501.1 vitamin K epoxide reductase [Chloroflexota bacterium]
MMRSALKYVMVSTTRFCLPVCLILFTTFTPALAQSASVRAVLFFSPTCSHCHKVMSEDLPPLLETYGDQLTILTVDTTSEQGYGLFVATIEELQIPQEQLGVPMLIVGEQVLVGSAAIPEQFPGIVSQGLVDGGIDWPAVPLLLEYLETEGMLQPVVEEPVVEQSAEQAPGPVSDDSSVTLGLEEATASVAQMTWMDRYRQDVVGNTFSVVVLLGMLYSLVRIVMLLRTRRFEIKAWPVWVLPILLLVGLFVAGYMSYVEITRTDAVCGPVGDCNTVQQSPYARLFGVLPIGVFGILGYLIIGAVWLYSMYGPKEQQPASTLLLWALGIFGTLFSVYLTFLEPFVIGATCAWCLSSSIIMTLVLWTVTLGGAQHLRQWFQAT